MRRRAVLLMGAVFKAAVTSSSETEPPVDQTTRESGGNGLPYPTSYPLRLRLLIGAVVCFIVVRTSFNIQMHKLHWSDELSVYTLPYALPTERERMEIRDGKSDRYSDLSSRFGATFQSLLRFVNPVPQQRTLDKISGAVDWLKYSLVWVHSRLEFAGRLVGVDERWTMYSPTVSKSRTVVRAVMWYQDGTTMEARALTEPEDLASFVRPFAQRRLQFDINLPTMEGVRLGWSRYLARNRPTNEHGAALERIDLYKITYKLPEPGQDYAKHWRSGNGRKVKGEPFWRFDVTKNKGENLEKKAKAKEKQNKLDVPKQPTPEPDESDPGAGGEL